MVIAKSINSLTPFPFLVCYDILLLLLAVGKVGKEDALYYLILKLSSIRFWNFVGGSMPGENDRNESGYLLCTVIVQRILLYEVR